MKSPKKSYSYNESAPLDPRWQLLLAHQESPQQPFFYGVITTGIYCRPSCPSPRPNPENVRFFDASDLALAAGFRPCKRCKPETHTKDSQRAQQIAQLCKHIESACDEPKLADLAALSGMSQFHLQREFKRIMGLSPKAYAKKIRKAD
jgi:AraC family transcriptional regulator, regulatory protein of adaptative response / methylated-DNA-[protein]-cysteine methyltransferase